MGERSPDREEADRADSGSDRKTEDQPSAEEREVHRGSPGHMKTPSVGTEGLRSVSLAPERARTSDRADPRRGLLLGRGARRSEEHEPTVGQKDRACQGFAVDLRLAKARHSAARRARASSSVMTVSVTWTRRSRAAIEDAYFASTRSITKSVATPSRSRATP